MRCHVCDLDNAEGALRCTSCGAAFEALAPIPDVEIKTEANVAAADRTVAMAVPAVLLDLMPDQDFVETIEEDLPSVDGTAPGASPSEEVVAASTEDPPEDEAKPAPVSIDPLGATMGMQAVPDELLAKLAAQAAEAQNMVDSDEAAAAAEEAIPTRDDNNAAVEAMDEVTSQQPAVYEPPTRPVEIPDELRLTPRPDPPPEPAVASGQHTTPVETPAASGSPHRPILLTLVGLGILAVVIAVVLRFWGG